MTVWIDSHHPAATLDAFLSVSENPTSFNDFNTTSNGTNIPMVTNFFQVSRRVALKVRLLNVALDQISWRVLLERLHVRSRHRSHQRIACHPANPVRWS